MKKRTKWIIAGAAVLGIGAAVIAAGGGKKEGDALLPVVNTETVGRKDLESTVILKGTVTGTDSASVYSKSAERIASIAVKEGDYVKQGQVLCELERSESADLMMERAEIELQEAGKNYEDKQFLFENGAASEDEVNRAKNALRLAEISLEELKREAGAAVTSPIAGTVTRVNTAVGKLAGGNNAEALFQIENIDRLQMRLPVSEYDIADVRVGQDVRITAEAIGRKQIHGSVTAIAPTGEAKAGTSEMVVPVVVSVDRDTELFAGITARAEIVTGSIPDALTVPVDALAEEDGKDIVFVVRDGAAVKTEVTILLEGDFYAAVAENGALQEGDPVILSPEAGLESGARVNTAAFQGAGF